MQCILTWYILHIQRLIKYSHGRMHTPCYISTDAMVLEKEKNYMDRRKLTLTQNHFKMAAIHCNIICPIREQVMSTKFRFSPPNCKRIQRTFTSTYTPTILTQSGHSQIQVVSWNLICGTRKSFTNHRYNSWSLRWVWPCDQVWCWNKNITLKWFNNNTHFTFNIKILLLSRNAITYFPLSTEQWKHST